MAISAVAGISVKETSISISKTIPSYANILIDKILLNGLTNVRWDFYLKMQNKYQSFSISLLYKGNDTEENMFNVLGDDINFTYEFSIGGDGYLSLTITNLEAFEIILKGKQFKI